MWHLRMHCNLKAVRRRASRYELIFRPLRLIRYVRDAVIYIGCGCAAYIHSVPIGRDSIFSYA